jgi:hypothetical protein
MGRVGNSSFGAVESAAGSYISFNADYWLDVCGDGLCVKLDCPEQVAVVGDGNRVHAQLLALFQQFVKDYRTIEQ